jgi:tRNA modification GTPase
VKITKSNSQKNPPESGFSAGETIIALATPKGVGALAIVRLSGEKALDITAGLIRQPESLQKTEPRKLFLAEFIDGQGQLLDRGMCVYYHKPNSYTGENAAEYFLHGSFYLIAKVLDRCLELGARIATPGEFTQRAFLNGKMDLAQAEAVADLIAASGAAAHRIAMNQTKGVLSRRIAQIREQLIQACAMIELDIDFSDQNLPLIDTETLFKTITQIQYELQLLAHSYSRGRLAREGAVVVIAGAPNVGKSTLFNALIGEDKAIVDPTPGTTRDSVESQVEWDGLIVRLVDTAGQAAHFKGPDLKAVLLAQQTMQSADLVLWIVDLSSDEPPIRPPVEFDDRVLLIGNKTDLEINSLLREHPYLHVSAKTGVGIGELKNAIMTRIIPENNAEITEGVLTRERHLEAVQKALTGLENGNKTLKAGGGIELLAEDLREAAAELGQIIGIVTPDDVLNRIFSDFCIGK